MAIFNSDDETRAFFDILGAETDVNFLSAPQVVVVDNETANFRVGDQIPIVTRSSQSTTSPDANGSWISEASAASSGMSPNCHSGSGASFS